MCADADLLKLGAGERLLECPPPKKFPFLYILSE
jgi:hypothetical protein